MIKRSSITWQIIMLVISLLMTISLLVIWIVNNAATNHWFLLTIGTVFLLLILVCVIVYFFWGFKEYRLNHRQANFIDSVTHELKSPLASIKLCLQTLQMRPMSPDQQQEFLKWVMEDVQRLDALIDHLLAVARIDHADRSEPIGDIPMDSLLAKCAVEIRRRYDLETDQIRLEVPPCVVQGRPRDLEMVFLNLLDNAVKYGGKKPQVLVQASKRGPERLLIRVADNGKGVHSELRGKIFQRFFRGGSELERTTKGTGLGLYIVKTLVGRMKGKIAVHNRGPLGGANFDVELTGRLGLATVKTEPPSETSAHATSKSAVTPTAGAPAS
ncbi:MAG: HAMP domain-containing histidine kinase [Planctomycetes bacterium]|nr:HAMP domain-containing histidine kinase [Planctomycetota bacterium]